jgi:DMSO reductase family type II enzyme heme b subunit
MMRFSSSPAWAAALGAAFFAHCAYVSAYAGAETCGAGKPLYAAKCSQCHGENGDGKGIGAEFFAPRPRDLTSGAFKIRATESGELPLDADLRRVIRKGMPYTGMPAWPEFSDQEVADLICYVKTFTADFADTSVHPKVITVPKAPAFSEASAQAGRAIYEENKCADCHGKWGRGDGESGPTLKDDWGSPIRPADLTKRWTFRGGAEREDIYRTFMTGLNGTPMPSFASSVKEEDRWKLVDYVYSLSTGSEPGYAGMVAAKPVAHLDSARLRESLAAAPGARLPVVGQVIEGARAFHPACNAVEVRAVYDSDRVAVLVSWHDMSAQKTGSNTPVSFTAADSAAGPSDAVAVQMPLRSPAGAVKPYFLFGDRKNPVLLRFADLGSARMRAFVGKGRGKLAPAGDPQPLDARYQDGEWSVAFFLPRKPAATEGAALNPGEFTPIAFSVWDGLSGETGEQRGITSWYSLYLEPQRPNPAGPAVLHAAIALAVGLGGLFAGKRWARRS